MCHRFLGQGGRFCLLIGPNQPIRGQGGHLVFSYRPKNTNLEEDSRHDSTHDTTPRTTAALWRHFLILLPVKFRWIPFSGFRREVENASANQRQGRPSCFSDRHKKHKFGRGRWDLASCQVSLQSVQRLQRRSRKCLSQSAVRVAILFFRSTEKTQTW